MKTPIKTLLAAVLLLAISCKKENSIIQSSGIISNNSARDIKTDDNDRAGRTVTIGTQVWMTKNLNVSHYRNGDKIPQGKGAADWAALTTGAWCWYNNDSATGAVYGKLYNWYAVHDPRGLAPAGTHVASDVEYTTLTLFLGGTTVAGGAMKETGTTHWLAPNTDATNSSGFTGLPGGYRNNNGTFNDIGLFGYWWTSTEYYPGLAWYRSLDYNDGSINRHDYYKQSGFSVRCLRD